MTDAPWPPPGHFVSHRMTVPLEGLPDLTFDITTPGAPPRLDVATFRVGRHGGPDAADVLYRTRLFGCIGAITAAGGHIESAYKRILLLSGHDPTWERFADVDLSRSDLEKKLAGLASAGAGSRARRLEGVLAWAERKHVNT